MTQRKKKDFIHQENIYNFNAPNEVVPYLKSLFNPRSVIDVGCGIGTWLKVFEENGVEDFLGIDGVYVKNENLKISSTFFKSFNLEEKFELDRKFDLAISLEVAEHLNSNSADQFIKSLCKVSDSIIFSAAIENQDGQDHINEQNPDYWISKFKENDFELFDVIRPVFWDNNNVDFWYRQNMMIFTKNVDLKIKLKNMKSFYGCYLVHPEAFKGKNDAIISLQNELDIIINGKLNIKYYIKLILIKIFKYKR